MRYSKEKLSRPGLFKNPIGLQKRLELMLEDARINAGKLPSREVSIETPPRWSAVLEYLYEEGCLSSPEVFVEKPFPGDPNLIMLRLRSRSSVDISDGMAINGAETAFARGISQSYEEAISKAIGEFLERYPQMLYREKNLIRAPIEVLERNGEHFLDPRIYPLFSEEQKKRFQRRNFTEQSVFNWVEGVSLTKNKKALIPAQLIFWNYFHPDSEPFLGGSITNGAAGMFTLDGAVLAGLCELIQRDAFLVYWLNQLTPHRIDLGSVKRKETQVLISELTDAGIMLDILDITSDFNVPVYLAVLSDTKKEPAISCGAGCGSDPESAILRAVTEALSVRYWMKVQPNSPKLPVEYVPFYTPISRHDHIQLWSNPVMLSKIAFLLSGPIRPLRRSVFTSTSDDLERLKETFKSKGFEIFVYEAKHRVLKRLGYHSVKVIVPGLLPLYLQETYVPLGARRIQDGCLAIGHAPAQYINPWPHPFP